jgi:shikimate dehydrogenase
MATWHELARQEHTATRIAVVGHGVDMSAHVSMFEAALSSLDMPSQVVPLDVSKSEFEACVRHLEAVGFGGVAVLHPHKVDAARVAERFWVSKYALGVANALMLSGGIFAQNTEVEALVRVLNAMEPTTALVMGTGHAARSVVMALFSMNWKVRVWNRNALKSRPIQTLFKRFGEVELLPNPDPSGCKLVVNATPLGAKIGEQPPLQWQHVQPRTVCVDLVYRRVATEFIRNARLKGLTAVDGREILVEQAALSLEWWIGRAVPRVPMRAAVGLK